MSSKTFCCMVLNTGLAILISSIAQGVLASPDSTDNNGLFTNPSSPAAGAGSEWGTVPIAPVYYTKVRIVHAVTASAAWLVFFPFGAILIRTMETSRVVQIHYTVQMAGYYVFIASAGMGIWMAKTISVLDQYHPMIGMTLLGCLAVQPLTEVLNHFLYGRYPKVIVLAHVHIWFGRLLITAGIIQGGLGFAFSASLPGATPDMAPRIAYGVMAILMWVLYVSLAIVWPEVKQTFGWWRRKHHVGEEGEGRRTRSLIDVAAPTAVERLERLRK